MQVVLRAYFGDGCLDVRDEHVQLVLYSGERVELFRLLTVRRKEPRLQDVMRLQNNPAFARR